MKLNCLVYGLLADVLWSSAVTEADAGAYELLYRIIPADGDLKPIKVSIQ